MLQIINFAVLRIMRVAAVEIDFTVLLNRLAAEVVLHHVDIMRDHQKGHVVMGMHVHNQLEESGLGLGVNTDGRLIQN